MYLHVPGFISYHSLTITLYKGQLTHGGHHSSKAKLVLWKDILVSQTGVGLLDNDSFKDIYRVLKSNWWVYSSEGYNSTP